MHESAIRMLVSPETLEPLQLDVVESSGDDVLGGTLVGSDETSYSIRGGIPDFVPADVAQSQTVRSFAQKWSAHQYYRDHTSRFYTDWYLQRYGFHETKTLREFLRGKEFILDAGSGSGRDAALFAEHSTATVFAVDTSRAALEVAQQQISDARVAFLQADLNLLPLPDEFFDFINCDQVIHHTPAPRVTFENLGRKLKPGGQISCYVYKKKGVVREFTDDHVREQICELPFDDALKVCEGITHLGQQLAALKVTLDVDHDIPALGIRKGKVDLQRFFHWNLFKCFWNEDFDFFTNNIINCDWYHPEHCHRFEPCEFQDWFACGWEIEAWDVQDAGISCRARKK